MNIARYNTLIELPTGSPGVQVTLCDINNCFKRNDLLNTWLYVQMIFGQQLNEGFIVK